MWLYFFIADFISYECSPSIAPGRNGLTKLKKYSTASPLNEGVEPTTTASPKITISPVKPTPLKIPK